MKKYSLQKIILILIFSIGLFIFIGCASSTDTLVEKNGAQLWGENCSRCHNAPPPSAFNDSEWETIGSHMRVRANITNTDMKKVVEFLQMAN